MRILTLLLFLSGCAPVVEDDEITLARRLCESHGGMENISTMARSAYCKNGVRVSYSKVKP